MFRKSFISIAALTLATAVSATPIFGGDTNNDNRTYNQGGQGGTATSVSGANAVAGAIAGAAVLGSGNSSVRNDVKNVNSNVLGQEQGQNQTATSNSAGGQGGNSNAIGGSNSNVNNGNRTSMVFERSAPAVSVGSQSAPVVDCRRTLGVGSSSPGGSGVVSGIPLWKESDCEGVMAVDVMLKARFPDNEIQEAACTIERVAQSRTCEKIRQQDADRKHALAVLSN